MLRSSASTWANTLAWPAAVAAVSFLVSNNTRAFPITMANEVAVDGAFGVGWLAAVLFGWQGVVGAAVGAAASGLWGGVPFDRGLLGVLAVAAEGMVGATVLCSGPRALGLNRLREVAEVVGSGTLAAVARGLVVVAAATAMGVESPLWQGIAAAGVAWFGNVLAASVGVVWRGPWRVPAATGRAAELGALVLLAGIGAQWTFGGSAPPRPDLSFPAVVGLAALHAWTMLRFHSHGLAVLTFAWFLVFYLNAFGRATVDPVLPLGASGAYQVGLYLAVGVLIAVELAVAAVAGSRAAEAAENARLTAELQARNDELVRQADAAAREHAFLDAVLAQLPAGVMIVAPDGAILRRNDRHRRLWQMQSATHQLGQLSSGTFSLSNNRRLPFDNWPIVRALLNGETTDGFEARITDSSGRAAPVDVSIGAGPVIGPDGAVLGAVSVMTDVTDRKATLASLRESEERLRIALQSARMLAYEWDVRTRSFRAAEPFRTWFGSAADPTSLDELLAAVHPEDADAVRRAADKVIAGAGQCELEFRIPTADGGVTRVMSRSCRMTDAAGQPADRVVGILIDLTDRHRNEDRLRLLESAVVHARDAVVILEAEPDGKPGRSVLYANAAFCALTGYAADEMVGRSLHFLRGPKSDPATLERLRDALDNGDTFQGELLNYRKDGSEFWVELSVVPVPDRDGRCAHFVMIQRDVSDRKRAEDELRRSEAMLADAQRIAHIGSWEFDPEAGASRWSAEEFRIFGRDPATFVPTPASVLGHVHPDDRERIAGELADLLSRPTARVVDYRAVRPTGEVRYVLEQIQPATDPDGRLTRLYGVTQDVTDRRLAQEQLAQAQKMELIGQMAGGIAHDFNNILTGIIGNLSRVQLPPADANRPMVDIALGAAARAADLTRQLLGFARRHQLLLAPVRAAEFAGEVAALIRSSFDPRVRVVTDLDPDASVSADATLMSQVLLNLCVNAKDAMPAGGTLAIEVRAADVPDPPTHPDARPGPHVLVAVEDTGTGMTDEVMAHLFEPFFTTKPVGQGTGLGLAMVHGIMRQHGGWVEYRSAFGVGTRFELYLPRLPVAAPGRGSPAVSWATPSAALTDTPPPCADHPATVLLVDDEEMIRDLARAVLEGGGYRVLEAEDGEEAVDTFRAAHSVIDLVILDLTMPRMSGQDAYRLIADTDPTVRVLFSSGYTPDDLSDSGGVLGLLPKPYRPHELLDAVRVALALTPASGAKPVSVA